jgi:hypothetical protein
LDTPRNGEEVATPDKNCSAAAFVDHQNLCANNFNWLEDRTVIACLGFVCRNSPR